MGKNKMLRWILVSLGVVVVTFLLSLPITYHFAKPIFSGCNRRHPRGATFAHMSDVVGSIHTYQKDKGYLPASLNNFPNPTYSRGKKDGWGRPFIYQKNANHFVLTSYGADGKPGGDGMDADYTSDMKPEDLPPITFSQYLHYGAYTGNLWGGFFAGMTVFILAILPSKPASRHPKEQTANNSERIDEETIKALIAIIFLSGFIGGLLTIMGLADGGH
jgi:hypothetical protein